jgi:hypothetical protein
MEFAGQVASCWGRVHHHGSDEGDPAVSSLGQDGINSEAAVTRCPNEYSETMAKCIILPLR